MAVPRYWKFEVTGLFDTGMFQYDDQFIVLTRELAQEAGVEIDEARFDELMAKQRERSRAAAKGRAEEELAEVAGQAGTTEFVGYQTLESDGRMLAVGAHFESGRVPRSGAEYILTR